MDAKTIIDSVASGKALEAKESLNSLLSARAFEALDAKKIELAQALFSTKDQIENEEEVEQIDELSKELLGRYLRKAVQSKENAMVGRHTANFKNQMHIIKTGRENPELSAASDSHGKTEEKRKAGIERAISRLSKEEVEQIDELSPELKARYLHAAIKDKEHSARGADTAEYASTAAHLRHRAGGREKGINRAIKSLAGPANPSADTVTNIKNSQEAARRRALVTALAFSKSGKPKK